MGQRTARFLAASDVVSEIVSPGGIWERRRSSQPSSVTKQPPSKRMSRMRGGLRPLWRTRTSL